MGVLTKICTLLNTTSVSGRETTKPKHPRQIEWNRNVNVYKKKATELKVL